MAKFRFTIREALVWIAWSAIYLAVRRAVFVRNSFFSVQPYWIEAHLGFVWSAVAIDRYFRPQFSAMKRYKHGMFVGMGAAVILAAEAAVSTGRMYHYFDDDKSLWNAIPYFAATLLGGLASGAVFGLGAVLFYSFLTRRRDDRSPPDVPPRSPPHLPDNRSPAHARAPS